MHLDNSHTIEIEADGLLIRMSNEIKPLLLKMLMDTLKAVSYTHLASVHAALVRLYGITMPDKRNPAANEYCFTPSNAEI